MSGTIQRHEYDNGMVLLAEPNASLESAAFTFLLPAGSVSDPTGGSGLASFTCEMALRGAGERDSRQFLQDLENLGVEHHESVTTSHTKFSGATLASNLSAALPIYADLLRRPLLPEGQLEAGRMVLMQELKAIDDDLSQKLMIELRRNHYPAPWGAPTSGELDDVRAIKATDIRHFYDEHYQPQGTILGVAGRFDFDQLRDQIGELFGDWKPLDNFAPAAGERGEQRQHLSNQSNQTHIGIAYDSLAYADPRYFQAWGAVGALSGGMSSRLFTEVRERRGLCYTVYASHHTLRDRGSVFCYAGTTTDRAQETFDVIVAELRRLAEGIEQHELNRLKARVKSAIIMQQESSSARSSSIARDWYLLGYVRTLDEVGRMIDELTCDSINGYLRDRPPGDFTVVTLGEQPLEMSNAIR